MQGLARRFSPPGTAELTNRVWRSRNQQCASSAAATSLSSQPSQLKRTPRKKIRKDERKSMVQTFVNKYRAMNSGKFPTISDVQREVGGSYYLLRNMVQELQYKFQKSSTCTRNESLSKKEKEPSKDSTQALSSQISVGEEISEDAHINTSMGKREAGNYESFSMAEVVLSCRSENEAKITDDVCKRKEALLEAKEVEWTDASELLKGQTTLTVELHENAAPRTETSRLTEATEKDKASPAVETVLSSQTADARVGNDNQSLAVSDVLSDDGSDKDLKEDGPASVLEEKTLLDKIAQPSVADDDSAEITKKRQMPVEQDKILYSTSNISESGIQEKTASKQMLEFDGIKSKDDQQQQSPKLENVTRDLSQEQNYDAEPEKESFTWKHLKSLADGIIKIWRKL